MSVPGRIPRWLARIELAEQVLLGLLVGAMVVLAALQILLRNAWGRGIAWADPFLGSAMLWITLLGALAWYAFALLWLAGLPFGDFGYSFEHELPVRDVVGDRLFLTVLVSFLTIILT